MKTSTPAGLALIGTVTVALFLSGCTETDRSGSFINPGTRQQPGVAASPAAVIPEGAQDPAADQGRNLGNDTNPNGPQQGRGVQGSAADGGRPPEAGVSGQDREAGSGSGYPNPGVSALPSETYPGKSGR